MDEPIRILQVFAQMNRGGAETMIMNLYRHIDRSKIQFDFVVHTEKKCAFDDEIEQLGGEIFRVPQYKGINHHKYKKAWRDIFNNNVQYRVIHGHVRSTASIYLKIAQKHKLVTIAHSHSTSSRGNYAHKIIKHIFQKNIVEFTNYQIACSIRSALYLFGHQFKKNNNSLVLANSIDINEYQFSGRVREKIRRELNIKDKYAIGHVGSFTYPKNHDFIIEIFYEIHKININTVLLLVGTGELFGKIKNKVQKLGLENDVLFLGLRSDVSDLLMSMDVFLFPSLFEGIPLALIEAQASGLKCITSDNVDIDVQVTDNIKKLSLSNSVEEWANLVVDNFSSGNRYQYAGIVEKNGYDIRKNAEKMQLFYEKIHVNLDS